MSSVTLAIVTDGEVGDLATVPTISKPLAEQRYSSKGEVQPDKCPARGRRPVLVPAWMHWPCTTTEGQAAPRDRAHGIAPLRRDHTAYPYVNGADGDGLAFHVNCDDSLRAIRDWI